MNLDNILLIEFLVKRKAQVVAGLDQEMLMPYIAIKWFPEDMQADKQEIKELLEPTE
jgi:hypothetical protein